MADLNPKNLLVLCFDSLGSAYQAIQIAGTEVDVLEVFPLGSQGHLILSSEKSLDVLLGEITTELQKHIVNCNHIIQCPAKVLKAYLSVENAELAAHLALAESAYIGDLMSSAASAVESGLQVMDLRMLRGASSSSYMFLTGDEAALQKFTETSKLKTTLIRNANKHIRDLFNIY